ncbi:hypothetical protein ACF1A9_10725 [Streptomyces sp. NPDC014872]|uniref:hypothetical protein n=1 Tax=Streptomyces sp. NPDC014872 TaxID=3364926 RepID=UPI0036FC1EFE
MPDESDLAAADAVIHAVWGHPVDELTDFLREGRVHDPALVAVLRIRTALVIDDSDVSAHQQRLHRLTRPNRAPLFYELTQVGTSSAELLSARAGSQALHAIRSVIDAYPENHLANSLTRSLARSATPPAEAARARSSAEAVNGPPLAQNTSRVMPTNRATRTIRH